MAADDDRISALTRSLLRLARAHSLCPDDADDAAQHAIERYLERGDVHDTTAEAWMRTVAKHAALKIRRQRSRALPGIEVAFDDHPSPDVGEVHERAQARERVAHVREALQALTPNERRVLLLKAEGFSYEDICARYGWSYSKVNRLLAEGRARFRVVYSAVAEGRACRDHGPMLGAIVAGEASVDDFVRLRPHLRHCARCRADLRARYEHEGCPNGDIAAQTIGATCR